MYIFTDLISILISILILISINSSALKLVPISPLTLPVSLSNSFLPRIGTICHRTQKLQITLLCTEKPEDLVHLLSFSICYTYTYTYTYTYKYVHHKSIIFINIIQYHMKKWLYLPCLTRYLRNLNGS